MRRCGVCTGLEARAFLLGLLNRGAGAGTQIWKAVLLSALLSLLDASLDGLWQTVAVRSPECKSRGCLLHLRFQQRSSSPLGLLRNNREEKLDNLDDFHLGTRVRHCYRAFNVIEVFIVDHKWYDIRGVVPQSYIDVILSSWIPESLCLCFFIWIVL